MKKNTWISFILAAALGFLVLCCTNGLSPDSKVKGDGVTVGDQLTINIHAEENLEIFATSNGKRKARTISAEAFKINDEDSLVFYISGVATSGQKLNPQTVTVKSDNGITGTVILDIDSYNWELTLAAIESDVNDTLDFTGLDYAAQCALVKKNAILIGSATVDMVFTNKIDFTLTPRGLQKPGKIALSIAREGNWEIPPEYKVTAGIYDIVKGTPIAGCNADGTEITDPATNTSVIQTAGSNEIANFTSETTALDPIANQFVKLDTANPDATFTYDATKVTYNANDQYIAPGTYLFQVEFKKDGEMRSYVWNDTIIVLPGKTSDLLNITSGTSKTKRKLIIIPNLIGTKPNSPSELTVTKGDGDAVAPGYYSAKFDWVATNVDTETNFALELIELKDTYTLSDTEIVSDTTWESFIDFEDPDCAAENYYKFDYLNDIRKNERFYYDGSLFANSSSVTVLLELGKRYLARIRSENNAGYSDNAAYIQVVDATDTTKKYFSAINKYRVTYHLQGGGWDTGTTPIPTLDKVDYSDWKTGFTVAAPRGTGTPVAGTAEHPYLHDGPAYWLYWTEGLDGEKYDYDESVDEYTPLAYTGFNNLDLYAKYSREGNVTVYDDNNYDIFQTYLSGLAQTGAGSTEIIKDGKITFSKSKAAKEADDADSHPGEYYTTISLTLPTDDEEITWKYDKVIFEVTYGGKTYVAAEQVGAARGSANEFKFYLTNFQTGYVYNCKVTAHYQRTVVSYPFALFLTD